MKKYVVYFDSDRTYLADSPEDAMKLAKQDIKVIPSQFNTELSMCIEIKEEEWNHTSGGLKIKTG